MVESIEALPISRHFAERQIIQTSNKFFTGEQRYRFIEDGLGLIANSFTVKENLLCKSLYDEAYPIDHYFFSFAVFEYPYPVNNDFTKFTTLESITCTFYKPKTEVDSFFYKNTVGKFYNIAFTQQWIEENLAFRSREERERIRTFLKDQPGFFNWLDMVEDAPRVTKMLWELLETEDPGKEVTILKETIVPLISNFFEKVIGTKHWWDYTPSKNPDYTMVANAEKIILGNLGSSFPGVSKIAREVGMSPTKLKTLFKSVFGFSMLQYHKEKNMLLALQLLQRSELQIKTIANLTGFETASKFTECFKKRFGYLPNMMRQSKILPAS